VSRTRRKQPTPPPTRESVPVSRLIFLGWAALVVIVFLIQTSSTDVILSLVFSLFGGRR
jgi:hypothetical protein